MSGMRRSFDFVALVLGIGLVFSILVGDAEAVVPGAASGSSSPAHPPPANPNLRQMLGTATGTGLADDASRSSLRRQLDAATGASATPVPRATQSAVKPVQVSTVSSDEIFWDGFELCGDGVVDSPSEQCDRSDLGGATCTTLGFTGGALACDNTCHYDTTQCTGCTAASCTNGCCFGDQCEVGVNCATCLSYHQPCTVPTDCCSNNCQNGHCEVPAGVCLFAHETCSVNGDCCSNQCDVNVDGVSRCSEPNQCKSIGAACSQAADCCSLDFESGLCSSAGTCTVVGASCGNAAQCCNGNCVGTICTNPATACSTLGEACLGNSNCCSGVCDGGRCDFDRFCRAEGDLCTSGSDCCNGVCNAGHCDITAASSCLTDNEPCTALRSCCGLLCSGTLPTTCTPIGGCAVFNEVCAQDQDCCTGSCGTPDANGLRRCANVLTCVADGNVCSGSGASQNCCSGGKANCQPTATGVSRCWPSVGGACASDGASCSFADQCCGHSCRPDASSATGFSCASSCLAAGTGNCTYDADCCAGSVCQKGVCQAGGPLCASIGGLCTTTSDCCSGTCTNGTCQ